MKKILFLTAAVFAAFAAYAELNRIEIKEAPFPFSVNEWTPPERQFSIVSYGAKADGKPVTEAIEKAIAAAHNAGGGRVIIPSGEWISGAFKMESNVALFVSDNAVLRFPDDPLIIYRAPLRSNGRPTMTMRALIQASSCTNVAVMGKGTLKADVDYWHRNFMLNPQRGFPRPQFFNFSRCKNVRFEGFKIRGSPAWTMHFLLCDDVIIRNVDSSCSGPNTDGIDLESCNGALVEGCSLDQTDDTYTIKSGFNEAGRKRNRPTQNVVIRNCKAVQGHALLAIGSEVSGGIRNIWMINCSVEAECWNWLFVKTNAKRGASVENVIMENIRGRKATSAIMNIEMFYDGNPNKELTSKEGKTWPTRIDGIVARNVVCEEAGRALRVSADKSLPPKNIVAKDIRIGRFRSPHVKNTVSLGNIDAKNVVAENITVDPDAVREVLDIPGNVEIIGRQATSGKEKEAVFEFADFEEMSENEIADTLFRKRIEIETSSNRNYNPSISLPSLEAMPVTLSGNRTRCIFDSLIDYGCMLPGALVADDVKNIGIAGFDGRSEKCPGVKLSIIPSAKDRMIRAVLENTSAGELKDIFGVLMVAPQWMTRQYVFRIKNIKPGEKLERTFLLGALRHAAPQPVGKSPYALHVDYTTNSMRSRLWAIAEEDAEPLKFTPPIQAARYVEPTDIQSFDDEELRSASQENGSLPSKPSLEWKKPDTKGCAWFNVTSRSRKYSEKEKKLLYAGRLSEAFAIQFESPDNVVVKMRFLPWLWDKKPVVFLNGEKINVDKMVFTLPVKTGKNRLVARYSSKPGEYKACTQCPIYTWSLAEQLNCLDFPITSENLESETVKGKVAFPLEWNAKYDTAVHYEVEIIPSKIFPSVKADEVSFKVSAKGTYGEKDISVSTLRGRTQKSVRLRFKVPEGTTSLSCTAEESQAQDLNDDPDNIFKGALSDLSKWKLTPRCKIEKHPEGGIIIGAKDFGAPEAVLHVPVPKGMAGKRVVLDVETENIGKETVVRHLRIHQFDASGNRLAEAVVDRRWTTHACPPGFKIHYLERGVIHPQAASLVAKIIVSSPLYENDLYGIKAKYDTSNLAKHRFTRFSLRPAVTLPFPKYDDSFFAEGVSGEKGDCALSLGGANEKAFWYQTRSSASWSEGVSLRDENLVFFPSKEGTVEAWFKSDWKAVLSDNPKTEKKCREYTVFQAFQGFRASEVRAGRGSLIMLSYRPEPGELTAFFREPTTRKEWSHTVAIKLPKNEWCHLALQWSPKATAEAFVNGRKVIELSIPGWLGCDLKDKEIIKPNDENAQEFFLGCACESARKSIKPLPSLPLLEGAVDLFRASTGKRYSGEFTPEKSFAIDESTRALFTFDRSFDGVSGGGTGWIPGTIRALSDRVDHTLKLKNLTAIKYWPSMLTPENDPSAVFNILNYPEMPTPNDFEAFRRPFEHSAILQPGEVLSFQAPKDVVTDYTEIENISKEPLEFPLLINSGELDPRSYGDIADTIDVKKLSPRERANKIFQIVLSASDYFQIHSAKFISGTDRPVDTEYDCMTMLNGYCGFECGPLNHLTANLFAFSGLCPASETAGYGHQFEQVFYDGKNHIYDLSFQKFFPSWDNETAAYLEEAGDQPGIFNRIGATPEHFIRMGHRGFWGIGLKRPRKIGLTLHQGEKFRVWQVNDGNCNDLISDSKLGVYRGGKSKWKEDMDDIVHADTEKNYIQRVERFFPHYLNGYLTFDGKPEKGNGAFCDIKNDSFCYCVKAGGYPIVAASYRAVKKDGGEAEIEISTDKGKTFRPLVSPATYAVRARMAYLIRVKAPVEDIARFSAVTELQLNPRVFPGRIKEGKNEFTLKVVSGSKARVRVGGRTFAGRMKIEGKVVHSGTVKGAELLFTAFDSSEKRELEVKDISPDVKIKATGNVVATIDNGKLTLESKDKTETAFGAVSIMSGGAEKTLAVFSGPGVRFATAQDVVVKGTKALLKQPDETSPQTRVEFTGHCTGESAAIFNIGPTPAGEYAVFNLNRFISHPEPKANDSLRMIWTGQKRASYPCGSPRNNSCNFLKANYGRKGERANFKWDYPYRENTWWLYKSLMTIKVPATETIKVFSWRYDPVEVAALLAVPNPSKEVRAELIKILCGFNTLPWRINNNLNPSFIAK